MLDRDLDTHDTYSTKNEELDDTFLHCQTIRGQKEKEEQQQKQNAFYPNLENNPDIENPIKCNQKIEEVKEIVEFWDSNGFGLTNVDAKEKLLTWLDDSSFLQPKDMIIKAMKLHVPITSTS